jgi:hypothetical protein
VVGERAQEWYVSDESVERSESLKQRKREFPDVGGRDESPYSAPIAQHELGMKGSRQIADGKKAHRNLERRAELFAAPSPAGFARLSVEQVPGCLPKAEVSKDTDSQMTAGADQPCQDRSKRVQVGYTIECPEVGDDSIKAALNAVELLDIED